MGPWRDGGIPARDQVRAVLGEDSVEDMLGSFREVGGRYRNL